MAFSWLAIVVFVVVIGGIATTLILRRSPRDRAGVGVESLAAVRVTRVVAIAYAVASAIGTVNGALRSLFDISVNVNLPVQQFWPSLPATVQIDGTHAQVVSGGFDQAVVAVSGLDATARGWLAAGDLLQGATNVMIGVVVAILCTSVIRQDPFRLALTRGLNLTALVIIIGGLGWQICDAVAGGLASEQVLGATSWSLDTAKVGWDDIRQIIGLPGVGHNWTVNFWPIWVGLALLTLSAAFRFGQKLQKDTQGLI